MEDDSGTHKVKIEDLKTPPERTSEGFTKDEIDSLADLISEGKSDQKMDLDDTGPFSS